MNDRPHEAAKAVDGKETKRDTEQTGPYASQGSPAGKTARLPALPGYELLGVLGKGGMGIVYLARHIQLDRPVALKMIRAADQVSVEALSRFLREARAVAHLQHPNIVQIYEIGEHDGLPYFSLEYVDGGSLDKQIKGQPQAPKEAAALVETLARAMNYAHQRQVVHRDLKPANILLQSKPELRATKADGDAGVAASDSGLAITDFSLKITDFGLAKQLDVNLAQTRVDAVMGTPSYMAPEQAAGHSGTSGPLADVYALGAILYELLTGRPPFKEASVLETLAKVCAQEPVPPSKLQPRVPHDLETICLKCLAKEPARRYGSALLLAQDLERFQAGEPILGRREGLLARSWRKLRRQRVAAAVVLVVTVALAAAGFVASKAYEDRQRAATDRRLAALTGDIDAGLRAPQLSEAYLLQLEAWIADLAALDPNQADLARQRLYQLFADRIRDSFRSRLTPEERPGIESALRLLTARDPSLANQVQTEYAQRQMSWEPSFELSAPFANLNTVIDGMRHRLELKENDTLLGRKPSAGKARTSPYVYTRVSGSGNVQLSAVYDRSWVNASELALYLNSSSGNGYSFFITMGSSPAPASGPVPNPLPSSFENARKTGRLIVISIRRTQASSAETLALQRVEAAHLFDGCPADGSLRLEAKREGERLTFHVNRREPLEFRDPFPLNLSAAGTFGLYWPESVQLRSLHGFQRTSPPVRSVLEHADDLYNQGEYERALLAYQQVTVQPNNSRVRQEARYKQGLCLVALKRTADAVRMFQALSDEGALDQRKDGPDRWSSLADCQLLLISHGERTPEGQARTDAILDRLALRQGNRSGEIAALIPFKDCQSIVSSISPHGLSLFRTRPEDQVRACERANKIIDLFQPDITARCNAQSSLLRAYWLAGREGQSMQISSAWLRDFQAHCRPEYLFGGAMLTDHCWMVRVRGSSTSGDVQLALKELDRWLFAGGNVVRREGSGSAHPLLIERARLHAALQMWDDAEKDLDQFFREKGNDPSQSYDTHVSACLLQGFLRERRGDTEGAQAAWRRGIWREWQKTHPKSDSRTGSGGISLINYLTVAALAGELTDRSANDVLIALFNSADERGSGAMDGASQTAQWMKMLNLRAEVFQQMWLSPRGRQWARRIAFRDLTFAEYVRVPVLLCVYEAVHQGTLPGPLSPEQDDILWQGVQDIYAAYLAGTIRDGHLLALGSVWKGLNIPGFGWQSVASVLEPSARGPAAYGLGHRYLRLKKPERAIEFFRTALADAPAGSPLRRLALTELTRLVGGSRPVLTARSIGLSMAMGDGPLLAAAILSSERSKGK